MVDVRDRLELYKAKRDERLWTRTAKRSIISADPPTQPTLWLVLHPPAYYFPFLRIYS